MQLNGRSKPVRIGLAAASCALLGAGGGAGVARAQGEIEQPWQVDAGLLYYKEDQGRVQTVEPVVHASKDYGDEHILGVTLAFDSLTGGSPNGAIPSRSAQTFATPSGTSLKPVSGVPQTYTTPSGRVVAKLEKVTLYDVAAGRLPLDPNFIDRRAAADVSWSQPLGTASHFTVGGHLSGEKDFWSGGFNAALSRDFNDRNTTLSFGVNGEYDLVKPVGGAPVAGSDYTQLLKGSDEHKNVIGAQVGLTQVLGRRWVAQLNYTYDRSSGYLTDPYKLVSVVDGTGAVTGYRFESRPDNRVRQSLYLGNKIAIGATVLDLSYRRGKDDWGVDSDTVDARWHVRINDSFYIEPHARWYQQGAADFYRLYLGSAQALPAYISADPRLAKLEGKTFGVKFGWQIGERNELSLRLEQYQQTPSDHTSTLAQLQGLDLNPGLKSAIVQLGWKFEY
ncbi:MAG: DUF3570 domain-containing protein [Steroidobacteraceae bacterium]